MPRFLIALLTLATTLLVPRPLTAQERGAVALGDLVGGLGVTARVLMIGAHPDDEDTFALTWFARARDVETAYLSITRGDGGQNLIGNELGEALGAIRTEELLAARRVDGARQYFTRAYDFGFSKSAEETYRHWPRDSILRDVVTVVRSFRPHIIIAVFSGTPRDGHGHHQVSGMLAREAYDLAADTVRFPRDATAGQGGWTSLKFYRASRGNPTGATVGYDVGEYDPLMGRSYAELAAESRSQHRSQGFGTLARRGVVMNYLRLEASRATVVDGAEESVFDGIETGWARLRPLVAGAAAEAALDSLPGAVAEARHRLDLLAPARIITPLVRVQRLLARACGGSVAEPCRPEAAGRTRVPPPDLVRSIEEQALRVNRALLLASGVLVEATAGRESWPVGEAIPVDVSIHNRGRASVRVLDLNVEEQRGSVTPGRPARGTSALNATILPDSALRVTARVVTSEVTQPWWLAQPRRGAIFAIPLGARSEDERALLDDRSVRVRLSIEGGEMHALVPVVVRIGDPVRGEVQRPVVAAPAIAVTLDRAVEYAPANTAIDREVRVTLRSSASEARSAVVRLRLPAGLTAEPATRTVELESAGASRTISFRLRGRLVAGRHEITALTESGGETFRTGSTVIDYEHIRPIRLHRDATITVQAVDLALPPGLTVGYVAGVGDNVAPMLRQLGIPVTMVDPTTVDRESLAGFRVVVVGPRAYEAHPALVERNAQLLDYARDGGTLVVQYGQYEMQRPGMTPYPITLSRPHARVTEEDSPVRLLAPEHVLLTTPNRIVPADFDDWVQERSLYMPVEAAPDYTRLLSLNDPGEPPNENAVLVAPYGAGAYVYTTLSFFRQLPAGNAGAARLFVNLLGAGQTSRP
ncbi:MAG TPA: PIG-L family deacetylase [Gemmatimonadaceae bacterium]|nr:PIG-L family deacetylase [Gemmatimonadaceae bacterium]